MKEAYGGISNLVFIAVFLTIVMGALGLTVSYTKAFHMKNAVLRAIENHEGAGCFPEEGSGGSASSPCRREIVNAAKRLTYSPAKLQCHGMNNASNLFCYKQVSRNGKRYVYRIVTQIDLSFPIIERITGFRIFQVSGDTREFIKP
jgi:hypothetical protein